jgi:hypothetical protein
MRMPHWFTCEQTVWGNVTTLSLVYFLVCPLSISEGGQAPQASTSLHVRWCVCVCACVRVCFFVYLIALGSHQDPPFPYLTSQIRNLVFVVFSNLGKNARKMLAIGPAYRGLLIQSIMMCNWLAPTKVTVGLSRISVSQATGQHERTRA